MITTIIKKKNHDNNHRKKKRVKAKIVLAHNAVLPENPSLINNDKLAP